MTDQLANAPADVVAAFERLTARQRAFALALPTAASQEAAMLAAGYAPQTARKTAATLAAHPDVAAVVDFLTSTALESASCDIETLLREAARIALADPLGAFTGQGGLKNIEDWPEELRRALSGIEVFEEFEWKGEGKERRREFIGYTKKIKFWDKPRTLELIAKIQGFMAPERHEHEHRIEGMSGLLKEINGADCGPGPASSRR
jgi:phage terminase small subunit